MTIRDCAYLVVHKKEFRDVWKLLLLCRSPWEHKGGHVSNWEFFGSALVSFWFCESFLAPRCLEFMAWSLQSYLGQPRPPTFLDQTTRATHLKISIFVPSWKLVPFLCLASKSRDLAKDRAKNTHTHTKAETWHMGDSHWPRSQVLSIEQIIPRNWEEWLYLDICDIWAQSQSFL